jgi:hypothetical protein
MVIFRDPLLFSLNHSEISMFYSERFSYKIKVGSGHKHL